LALTFTVRLPRRKKGEILRHLRKTDETVQKRTAESGEAKPI
jgi:hypothetical protein